MNVIRLFDRGRSRILVLVIGAVVGLTVVVGLVVHLRLSREQETWLWIIPADPQGVVEGRIPALTPLRTYRLAIDTTTTAERAGQAVHAVLVAGEPRNREQFREPTHVISRPWLPDTLLEQMPEDGYAEFRPARLFRAAIDGLSDEKRALLEFIASHPGFVDYSIAARAGEADLISARYELPFPSDADYWSLPNPRIQPLKRAAHAHVARAALAIADDRLDDAEEDIRAVLSFGFLLIDEATSLFDTLAGQVTLNVGQDALREFLSLTGRDAEAAALPAVRPSDSNRTARQRTGPKRFTAMVNNAYRTVGDSMATRGLRWERLVELTYLPCTSVTELLFGPDDKYERTLEEARRTLVRRESDAALFELILATPERARVMRPCAETL